MLKQIIFGIGFSLTSYAVTKPKKPVFPPKYQNMQTHENALKSIVVYVNGKRQTVLASRVLNVKINDVLNIESAELNDGGEAAAINLVGFRNPKGHAADQGFRVHIKNLESHWELSSPKRGYQIIVSTGNKVHGYAFLAIVDSTEVYSVRMNINGRDQVFRMGEEVVVKASDIVKVVDVTSNVPEDQLDVSIKDSSSTIESSSLRQSLLINRKGHGIVGKVELKIQDVEEK